MLARVVLLLVVVACRRESSKPAAETCLVDDLPALNATYTRYEDCTAESRECREACEIGDADACITLAYELQKPGDLETGDTKEVAALFERACRFGAAGGCTNWAADRFFNHGTPSWMCLYRVFKAACDSGERFGCGMRSRMLVQHPRTQVDVWIGRNQLEDECERLQGPPCRFLAYYIEQATFGPVDPNRVKLLLERACKSGDDESCGKERAQDAMN